MKFLIVILVGAGLLPIGVAAQTSRSPSQSTAQILAAAAKSCGANVDRLEMVTSSQSTHPVTRGQVTQAKVYDQETGRTCGISLDAGGQVVDLQAALAAQSAADRAQFATMTAQLADIVAKAAPSEVIQVGFWLKSDHARAVTRPATVPAGQAEAIAEARGAEAASLDQVREAVGRTTEPFADTVRATGQIVKYVAPFSPAVFASVSAGVVPALAADPRVDKTYYTGDRLKPFQDIAVATSAASKVHGGTRLISGIGVKGGVVECCGSLFEEDTSNSDPENNAYLARIHELRAGACGDPSHPTAVAGIMTSTHSVLKGSAPNGRLVFDSGCTGDQAEVASAISNVVAQVDGAMNHSYGIDLGSEPCPPADGVGGIMERLLDDAVRNSADSQYVAAGNAGNTNCVGSPATAWNVTAVGAFDDGNTSAWSGDTMAGFSSGGDPASVHGDRQKPEVAGPGVNFQGLFPSNGGFPTGSIGSGTSYAAPLYAGGGLLVGQRRPALLSWPEGEKAVMLASACHNIEGGQTNSELDGAGGPDFFETDVLLSANRFQYGSIDNGSGEAVSRKFTGIASGNEMRVALAWDTNPAYDLYGSQPSDDLDLSLFGTCQAR